MKIDIARYNMFLFLFFNFCKTKAKLDLNQRHVFNENTHVARHFLDIKDDVRYFVKNKTTPNLCSKTPLS